MDEDAKPRLSASLILVQPLEGTTSDGYDYQTLLVQRHATKGSFLSAHVFPGGNIDEADFDRSWQEAGPSETEQMRALKVCAIRETFEECGLLAASSSAQSLASEERAIWRRTVHDKAAEFGKLVRLPSAGGLPSLQSLVYRGNFVTPSSLSKRWDTHFFMSMLPPLQPTSRDPSTSQLIEAPAASSDGVETVSVDWLTPLRATQRALLPRDDPQRIILAPPQFYFLAELAPFRRWRDLVDESGRPKERKVVPFEPEIKVVPTSPHEDEDGESSFATVLPGDPYHSVTPSLQPQVPAGVVHRTYIIPPSGGKPGGLTIKGVRRQGVEAVLGPGWADMGAGVTFEAGEGAAGVSKL